MKKVHLAGKVQRKWLAGMAQHPPRMKRHCPNCGARMKHQKRACSVECFAELKRADHFRGHAA